MKQEKDQKKVILNNKLLDKLLHYNIYVQRLFWR